ncbi:MAG: serine/threonine protein kinase [Planctomycetia bacterium]|nr:serine/threonine protein kinase [Planctomycetia bacterium]
MGITSSAALVRELEEQHLLKPVQFQELARRGGGMGEPKALAQELIRRGWLTEFQARLLLQGQGRELVLGPFDLIDRLGEGGMGQVFKARHRGMQRIVALKVLRRELVNDPETVARFYREIKVASQLKPHPNLVQVFDAGPLGATHFLEMEYVEGTDMQALVEKSGRLSLAQACDCLRQAALGLQHAHEHGLVHRDIKPANLLLTSAVAAQPGGVVKVIDLGLARLQGQGTKPGQTLLTTDGGTTMGTIDYQAPEQALDFHKADIRADIYSLGCVLYYLLTGKPPFGSGPLAIKLMRHQQAEPPDLKERRPDVPEGLVPIVQRLLAKKPADRYQTPGAVAAALAQVIPAKPPEREPRARQRHGGGRWLALLGQGAGLSVRLVRAAARGSGWAVQRRPRLVLGGVVGLALGVAFVWWLLGPTAALGPRPGTSLAALPAPTGLARLRARAAEPRADAVALWRDVLAFRMKNAGTPEAAAAAELQMRLPSQLDQLDPARIKEPPAGMRPAETVAVMSGHRFAEHAVKFSPDGRTLALCGDPTHLELALYDLSGPEPKLLANLTGHTAPLFTVAFSPDGKLVASGGADKSVRLWDLSGPKPQALRVLEGHAESIRCLAFAPDGKTLASGSADQTVRLWNLAGAEAPAPSVLPIKASVASVAYAQDSRMLATGGYDGNAALVKLWDLTVSPPKVRSTWNSAIDALALSPDGQRAAAGQGNDGGAALRDLTDPAAKPLTLAHWHDGGVRTVQFSVDGKTLFTCDGVGRLRWWEAASGKSLQARDVRLATPRVDLAPDGRHVAAAPPGNYLYILRLGPAALEASSR